MDEMLDMITNGFVRELSKLLRRPELSPAKGLALLTDNDAEEVGQRAARYAASRLAWMALVGDEGFPRTPSRASTQADASEE